MAFEKFENFSDLSIPLFALYLLIFCNFSKETLGCKLQYALNENMYFKHFITFLLLLLLVVMIDPNSNDNLLVTFGYSLLTYILFIITTRTSFVFMIIIIILLLIIYILNILGKKKKEENDDEEYKKYKLAQNILFVIVIIIGFTGFVIYGIEKYAEYGDNFSILTFIFGQPHCKNYNPPGIGVLYNAR